jgi:hypothetical protein
MNFFRLDRAAFEAAIRSYAAIPIVDWPTSVMGPTNDEVRTAIYPPGGGWPSTAAGQPYRVDR